MNVYYLKVIQINSIKKQRRGNMLTQNNEKQNYAAIFLTEYAVYYISTCSHESLAPIPCSFAFV